MEPTWLDALPNRTDVSHEPSGSLHWTKMVSSHRTLHPNHKGALLHQNSNHKAFPTVKVSC